jgi:hypothetical protein
MGVDNINEFNGEEIFSRDSSSICEFGLNLGWLLF